MSWQGPSAPRVEGIATKSRVVLSWASKPASTASRIRFVSLAFMVVIVPLSRDQTTSRRQWAGEAPFRIAAASLRCEIGKEAMSCHERHTHPVLLPAATGDDAGGA